MKLHQSIYIPWSRHEDSISWPRGVKPPTSPAYLNIFYWVIGLTFCDRDKEGPDQHQPQPDANAHSRWPAPEVSWSPSNVHRCPARHPPPRWGSLEDTPYITSNIQVRVIGAVNDVPYGPSDIELGKGD